ncbi:MAG: serine/threonine protein kinase [Phycisphaerales bacterium]|nr:serine/threonine protein kinase [Phycisphaerales bacterium]
MRAIATDISRDEALISRARNTADAEPAPAAPPPERPAGYQIIREIRRGGQGVVYQAVHEATERDVAIKMFHVRDGLAAADFERFGREARSLRGIDHPGVVAIHDTGVVSRRPYIVMAYIEGCSLDEHIAMGPLDEREAMRLFRGLCEAVHAAHLRGVIHRDLKPGNVRIDTRGDPYVLDFGLAKMLDPAGDEAGAGHTITHTGQFLGTLPWASPEQVDGRPDAVDARTDVYALGALLFYMLTGRPPIDLSGSDRDVLNRIVNDPPLPPRDVRHDISDDIQTIILKCLAKEKERRYQSASELAAEARRWLEGKPIEAKRDSVVYVARKFIAQHRAGLIATAALLLLAAGATALIQFERRQAVIRELHARFADDTLNAMGANPRSNAIADIDATVDQLVKLQPGDAPKVLASALEFFSSRAAHATSVGQYDEAIEFRIRAIEFAERAYGTRSAEVVRCCADLASDARAAGRFGLAERESRRAVALATGAGLDPADRTFMYARSELALSCQLTGHIEDAVSTLHASIAVADRAFAGAPGELAGFLKTTSECMFECAKLLREQGAPSESLVAEAGSLRLQSLMLARRVFANEPTSLDQYVHSYSVFLRQTGRFVEAEPLALEALELRTRHIAPDADTSRFLCASQKNLGVIRMEQGRYEDAAQLLNTAFEGLDRGPYAVVRDLRKEIAGDLSQLHARWAVTEPGRGHEEVSKLWWQMAGGYQ